MTKKKKKSKLGQTVEAEGPIELQCGIKIDILGSGHKQSNREIQIQNNWGYQIKESQKKHPKVHVVTEKDLLVY